MRKFSDTLEANGFKRLKQNHERGFLGLTIYAPGTKKQIWKGKHPTDDLPRSNEIFQDM
jgi:hypothetical protein